MASSERTEQDSTQVSVPESTDTEMYQALEKDLLISSDYQAGWREMSLKFSKQRVVSNRLGTYVTSSSGNPTKRRKKYITLQERGMRGMAEASLRRRWRPASPRGNPTLSGDVPSGIGSPLTKHPGNRVPQGDFRLRFQAQLKVTYGLYTSLGSQGRGNIRPSQISLWQRPLSRLCRRQGGYSQ